MRHSFRLLTQRHHHQTLRLLVGVCSGLLISNVVLGVHAVRHQDRLVLVPPSFSKDRWLEGDTASVGYIQDMSLFLAHLLLDGSPQRMTYNRETLLKYVIPASYSAFHTKLLSDAKVYQEQAMTTTFHPVHVTVQGGEKRVILVGDLKVYTSSKEIETKRVTYSLGYTLEHGRFYLVSFQMKEGA